jgi:hypothetical protein
MKILHSVQNTFKNNFLFIAHSSSLYKKILFFVKISNDAISELLSIPYFESFLALLLQLDIFCFNYKLPCFAKKSKRTQVRGESTFITASKIPGSLMQALITLFAYTNLELF